MIKQNVEALANLVARRGILFPAFSVYGEIAGFYDMGPVGLRIRQNIVGAWRDLFINKLGNLEIEATIIAPEAVFEASGHLSTFTDPLTKCTKCKNPYRADKLLAEYFIKKGDLDAAAKVKFYNIDELDKAIKQNKLKCPKDNSDLGKVELFNLMMGTMLGPLSNIQGYLRPETAQSMYIDFKNMFKIYGLKLPVAIGQVGKAFRNEISPRNILIRMREFTQLELEYFFDPSAADLIINGEKVDEKIFAVKVNFLTKEAQNVENSNDYEEIALASLLLTSNIPNKLMAFMIYHEVQFLEWLGFNKKDIRFRRMLDNELPHYSRGNVEVEARFNGEWEEIGGNAYRTDFDLSNHQKFSKQDMSVVNDEKKIIPHVDEISMGLDRIFWILLANSLYMDDKRGWEVMLLNENAAPYKYAVFPLQKDENLLAKAMELNRRLAEDGVSSYYSASSSIGKRYAKADEIGIPYAITVDYQTLEDNTVTVRDSRDAGQVRKKLSEIK